MDPVASFRYETFRDRAGETFTVPAAGIELVLASAADMGAGTREGGAFSLYFHGPADPMLLQAIHELKHDELGEFGLFLVPVGRTDDGFEYEAAFC